MRQENYADLHSGINAAIDNIIKNPKTIPYQNCLNCEHWNEAKDICGLYNVKPPTEILIYSCPSYKDDQDIPF